MDLITLMLSKRIGGIPESEFEKVLMGTHESLGVKKSGQAMIMLTNNNIVKCVSNYYKELNSSTDKKIKHSNPGLQCHYTHETLGIVGIDVYQCAQCHLRCLHKLKQKEVRRNNSLK